MLFCDYCKKSQEEVKRMIVGYNGAAICSECVAFCLETLLEEVSPEDKEISFKKKEKEELVFTTPYTKESSGIFTNRESNRKYSSKLLNEDS